MAGRGNPATDWQAAVRRAFGAANVRGAVHAIDLDRAREVAYHADASWPSASVGKVAILAALMRRVATGALSLDERIRVPGTGRTPGPTGLSVMRDEVELSLRDVALSMIAVSDNHATDVVLERVTPVEVTGQIREIGLRHTAIECTIADMYRRAQARMAGVETHEEALALLRTDPDLQPGTAPWRTTARDVTTLLGAIWHDRAAPAGLCAQMREMLRACVTSHGLASAFPPEVRATLGHKTGTLASTWNEVGVAEYPDGGRYAVAVLTRGDPGDGSRSELVIGRAIATAARVAVERLRADVAGPD